jgi:dipeptidyl aminopeptidase/acylaminoacyl peptidase
MTKMKIAWFHLAILILFSGPGLGQRANLSKLSIEMIMQKTEFWRGAEPENIFWGHDNQSLYFDWNPKCDTLSSLYRVTLKNHQPEKVSPEESVSLPGRIVAYNSNKTHIAFIRQGNVWVRDLRKNREYQLSAFRGEVSLPWFTADDSKVLFIYNQNLYATSINGGILHQLTDFISGEERPEPKKHEQALWLERQQQEIFDVLKERDLLQKAREIRKIPTGSTDVPKIYLGKQRLGTVTLSPTENFIAYTTYFQPEAAVTGVTHFITASGYTEERTARSKVGSPNSIVRLSLYDRTTGKVIQVRTDQLPGLKDLPDFLDDYPEKKPAEDKIENRTVNLSSPVWNGENDRALVIARAHDNKDRWICLLDPSTGILTSLDRQRDEAWIAGPGIGGFSGSSGWLPDNQTAWFQSEESGYSHLYTLNVITGEKRQITAGSWEVYDPGLSEDGKYFWFTANIKHPGIRNFYRISVAGGQPQQITSLDGGCEVTLSPDRKWIAFRHSTGNTPWELYIQENKPGAEAHKVTHSTTKDFNAYPWRMPEYVTFQSEDGATVHARLYRPQVTVPQGPAVIFVHGAGYLQNAHQWWSSYYREYMFHNFLADNGYTVLDIDFRGSAGYGRDWRTGIYRNMGGNDLNDHVDGARFLIANCDISPDKIGIYGGSYGGFITLMAMFKYPEIFAAGAALRSVTDWAHYNHGYTSNILNTPVGDSLAFVRSSPIYYAGGLRGALLMCHGMVDDNVQFQDIVRLTQRLIELGKENWELAVYPVESHAFTEPSSWVDEYKRIYRLFEENLK